MDATTVQNKSFQPKTMAELLPDLALSGMISKDALVTLTARKKPRATMAVTRTTEKVVKPLTMAEMRAEIQAFNKSCTPARAQSATSTKKRGWNSSVKTDSKKVNHTTNGNMRNNVVRKLLNFQPKVMPPPPARPVQNTRVTMMPAETPKFPKPEFRAKKSIYVQAKTNVRISGICNIPETPVEVKKPIKKRMTMANKENNSNQANVNRKTIAPKTYNHKRLAPPSVPDTPLSNDSWKSAGDASFLQREKEINDNEEKVKAILEHTLENIAEVSPPVSTPFMEYRTVTEYFENSSFVETSSVDNTIMCFDNTTKPTGSGREESVIVSLCDMLNRATVSNSETNSKELDDLLKLEKQKEHDIKVIENGIQVLIKIKESQQSSLRLLKKEISNKRGSKKLSESDKEKTLIENKVENDSLEKSPVLTRRISVIKSPKSPSYKIPKKNLCLRKKVICKSMPNVSTEMSTPVKLDGAKALTMYMQMKEQLNFLNTPLVKSRSMGVPDTPAVTSQNLQMQLNKLYNES